MKTFKQFKTILYNAEFIEFRAYIKDNYMKLLSNKYFEEMEKEFENYYKYYKGGLLRLIETVI